jgi:hypothetical protein
MPSLRESCRLNIARFFNRAEEVLLSVLALLESDARSLTVSFAELGHTWPRGR